MMRSCALLFTATAMTSFAVMTSFSEDGFVRLFDGKTFHGWQAADMSWWTIEDGAITGTITEEKPCKKNQYIFYEPQDKGLPLFETKGMMSNFELKLTHRIRSPHKVNGGFQYRSEHYEDGDCKGYQIDNNTQTPWLARMYDEFGRHTLAWRGERAQFDEAGKRHVTQIDSVPEKAHFALEEWHEYHLVCRDTHMTLHIDGQLVAEVHDNQPSAADLSGLFAPQLHSGPPMVVQFKDILFKPLPESKPPSTDKTLVSWVTITDPNLRSGSVLTIQDGDRFDGIIYAELAPRKWMAGSNFLRRTNKNQQTRPAETMDTNTPVQMAIVHQDDRISIYRNGELYESHPASNVDLLKSKNNIAVFGLRHIGGDGSIGGTIDDARIYNRALSVDELKALKPNQPSELTPYAWWDFEEAKGTDRTGRFPHSKLTGGANIADGKLFLGNGAKMVAARSEAAASVGRNSTQKFVGPYVPETPAWPENPPDNWPIYHLAHPTFSLGSPFDPNPALFYKGRYHLHYIYKNHTGFVFAHVSSADMVHWTWHPTVLAPPTTGHGMFSGTGFFTREGKPAMVYCGTGSGRNWIAYAQDDDLNTWSKPEVMLPVDKNGKRMDDMPYFDPDIWLNNGIYYGMNARSSREAPVIMKSDNLKDWTHIDELLHADFDEQKLGVSRGEDISCPNMFKLGNKWMLLCISHRLGCRYFIGDFKNEQYLPESHAQLGSNSNRYFAPESLLTQDGRRVMWAWFRGGGVQGVQSLPTELSLAKNGILNMKPLRELEQLRYDEITRHNLVVKQDQPLMLKDIRGDHLELNVLIHEPGTQSFGVGVLGNKEGRPSIQIRLNREQDMLEVGNEKLPFTLKPGEPLTLRIFIDATLVEVFANDRQVVMTDKNRTAGTKVYGSVSVFTEGSDLTVDTITAWQMKSAYAERP